LPSELADVFIVVTAGYMKLPMRYVIRPSSHKVTTVPSLVAWKGFFIFIIYFAE